MRVKEPILPISMVSINADFPKIERVGVIPDVRPQVENADIASKNIWKKVKFFSVNKSMKTMDTIHVILSAIIAMALYIISMGIVLPKNSTEVLFLIIVKMVANDMKKVVVFTPLPVEFGLAPMNIRIRKITSVAIDALSISIM